MHTIVFVKMTTLKKQLAGPTSTSVASILSQAKGKQASLTVHDDRSLLAVQGPAGVKAVQALSKADFSKLYFSHFTRTELKGIPVWITRTG